MHCVVHARSLGLGLKFSDSMDLATFGDKIHSFVTCEILVWCECGGVSLNILFSVILLHNNVCNTWFLI